MKTNKQAWKTHIYDLCICWTGSIYAYIAIYTLAHSPYCIYIYIQRETLKYHAQATGAAGNCSQHGITKHQSPPKATAGFYQEIS